MEGLCDMFSEENPDNQSKGFVEENEYKFLPVNFDAGGLGQVEIFQMDGKEESVLIG